MDVGETFTVVGCNYCAKWFLATPDGQLGMRRHYITAHHGTDEARAATLIELRSLNVAVDSM